MYKSEREANVQAYKGELVGFTFVVVYLSLSVYNVYNMYNILMWN